MFGTMKPIIRPTVFLTRQVPLHQLVHYPPGDFRRLRIPRYLSRYIRPFQHQR